MDIIIQKFYLCLLLIHFYLLNHIFRKVAPIGSTFVWYIAAMFAPDDDFVPKLESGIDTLPGERWNDLSEGQMQRIAVKRAMPKRESYLPASFRNMKAERLLTKQQT